YAAGMAPAGRPRLFRARSSVRLYLETVDLRRLHQAARAAGLSLRGWARVVLLEAAGELPPTGGVRGRAPGHRTVADQGRAQARAPARRPRRRARLGLARWTAGLLPGPHPARAARERIR